VASESIDWLYCDECGWQTDQPGIACVGCKNCGNTSFRYLHFQEGELDYYLPVIKELGVKKFVDTSTKVRGFGVGQYELRYDKSENRPGPDGRLP
jgi:hypothetical protein